MQNCPKCGLVNPDSATLCDCGYNFQDLSVTENKIVQSSSRTLKANKKIVEEAVCKICNDKFTIGEDIEQCENCKSFFHYKCWEECGGCNQHESQENTKPCPSCGKTIKKSALKCRYCGQYLDEKLKEALGFINEDLKKYLLEASGISRIGLNITAFIGVFIFGWLIGVIFSKLGKGGRGWAYFVPIIIFAVIGHKELPALASLSLLIYIAAWVHANMILSRYKSLGKERIAEINRQGKVGIDGLLEKGLILNKVLGEQQLAIDVFTRALQLPGGSPVLLNMGGVVMSNNEQYKEASEFFNRALRTAKDESLVKQIKKNLAFAEKKIK